MKKVFFLIFLLPLLVEGQYILKLQNMPSQGIRNTRTSRGDISLLVFESVTTSDTSI